MKVRVAIDWSYHVICSIREALDSLEVTPFEQWLNEAYEPSRVWEFDEETRERVLHEYEEYIENEREIMLHYHYDIREIDI